MCQLAFRPHKTPIVKYLYFTISEKIQAEANTAAGLHENLAVGDISAKTNAGFKNSAATSCLITLQEPSKCGFQCLCGIV